MGPNARQGAPCTPPSHNPMVAACFEREAGQRTEGRGTPLLARSLGVREPGAWRAASHAALCYAPALISHARHWPCLTRNTRHPQTRENVSFCLNQLGWHLRGREDPDDKFKSELQVCASRALSSFSLFPSLSMWCVHTRQRWSRKVPGLTKLVSPNKPRQS